MDSNTEGGYGTAEQGDEITRLQEKVNGNQECRGEPHMSIGLLIDAADRFPLGARNGAITPTTEPVSDTGTTPFGLSLRTIPIPRNVVRVCSVDGVINMATEKLTSMSTDGSDEGDTRYDAENDI